MTISSRSHQCDYVVLGGGCFGASTVRALIRQWPDARIIWFVGSATHTASKDINKSVRTVYPDEDFVAFARQAMRKWEKEAPYCNFYHPTSWFSSYQ
jgi:glycine/D-amino acid oxidase-like deaminating enzyme